LRVHFLLLHERITLLPELVTLGGSASTWYFCSEEEVVEDVFRVHEITIHVEARVAATTSAAGLSLFEGVRTAHLVVNSAFFRVAEACHRRIDFLEGVSRLRRWVFIWVHLDSLLLEGTL